MITFNKRAQKYNLKMETRVIKLLKYEYNT
jgi:hypothetical protein